MNKLYCIACPNGCLMTIIGTGAAQVIEGYKCEKGREFAKAELDNPMRTLTTTVRTKFPDIPVISVRTDGEIPKHAIRRAMSEINEVVVETELSIGDVVLSDVADTGISVIITSPALMQIGAELENKNVQLNKSSSSGSGGVPYTDPTGIGTVKSPDDAEGVLNVIGDGFAGGVVGTAGESVGVEDVDENGGDGDDADSSSDTPDAGTHIRRQSRPHIKRR